MCDLLRLLAVCLLAGEISDVNNRQLGEAAAFSQMARVGVPLTVTAAHGRVRCWAIDVSTTELVAGPFSRGSETLNRNNTL